jgi:hypothetical protein
MNGRKIKEQKSVLRKRMGITALAFNAFFFNES